MKIKFVQLSSTFDYAQAFTISNDILRNGSMSFLAETSRTRAMVVAAIVSTLDTYGEDSNVINTSNDLLFCVDDDTNPFDYIDDSLTIIRTVSDDVDIPYTSLSVDSKYVWAAGGLAIGYLLGN